MSPRDRRSIVTTTLALVLSYVAAAWLVRPDDEGGERPASGESFEEEERGPHGVIAGVVTLAGERPEMQVPSKRREAELCRHVPLVHDAVRGLPGKLQDVVVRLSPRTAWGSFSPPRAPARVDQVSCVYVPRVQAAMVGQDLEVHTRDATLHNVHAYEGADTWFNQAQPKGSKPIQRKLDRPGIVRLGCDVHPWMRAFVFVSHHPYVAITAEDGSFEIRDAPTGTHTLEAWHSLYGWKRAASVEVSEGTTTTVTFEFDVSDPEPPENPGELRGLW